jgi:2-iminobutanoate/2-iminopropanoate deaminase
MSIAREGPAFPGFTFSNATVTEGAGRLLFISGQLGLDEEGRLVAGEASADLHVIFARIAECLAELGGKVSDIVKVTAYLRSLDDYATYSAARGRFFGEHLPASTAVEVKGLVSGGGVRGTSIEVEAIAFLAS